MNRRDFLKTSTLAPLGALAGSAMLGGFSRLLGQQAPVKVFEAGAALKVGLNAYSFAKELNAFSRGKGKAKGMSLFQLIDYCADPAHRFDAVDITGYYFPNYSATETTVPDDDFIKQVRKHAAGKGVPISGTGIGNTFTGIGFDRGAREGKPFSTDEGGDPKKFATDIERIKLWVEVAAKLGAPVLRVFAGLEPSYLMKQNIKPGDPLRAEKAEKLEKWRAKMLPRMAGGLRDVTAHAKKFGVIIGIQNHGDFLKTADECVELLKAVDSAQIGMIVDTGYFLTPDPYVDVEKVMPYAVNFQIKEFARVCPSEYMKPPFQPMDVARVIKIVRKAGYKGYLPIETLSAGKSAPY
ncbi:MAG: sugar phosphate isomerase/epimerase, partial [Opitutaceae bacterium]|nr:sugar phosphate isomerase/epimerase [Opitutaceae bacterium]